MCGEPPFEETPMAVHRDELMQAGYDAFGRGDLDFIRTKVLAPGVEWTFPGYAGISGTYHGVDEVFRFFGQVMTGSGGTFTITPDRLIEHGNNVVALCSV